MDSIALTACAFTLNHLVTYKNRPVRVSHEIIDRFFPKLIR
jgi:hypothetical protein